MSVWNGEILKMEIGGTSHGPAVTLRLEGLPCGESADAAAVSAFTARRSPGGSALTSARCEKDAPVWQSGVRQEGGRWIFDGRPLAAAIENTDVRKADYERNAFLPRPGHADYPAYVKYGFIPSGGGAFSGRLTAPLVLAGGIAVQMLLRRGIRIYSRLYSVGEVRDLGELTGPLPENGFPTVDAAAGEAMQAAILREKAQGDSLGGTVECVADGLPVGLGGPLFEGLECKLASLIWSIPGVKGLEIGDGFRAASARGSENNDAYLPGDAPGKLKPVSNHAGGLLGGLTNGMPLRLRAAFKPTPSIAKPQQTVHLRTGEAAELRLEGRHDPCIAVRARVAVEAAAALAVLDAVLASNRSVSEGRQNL